MSLYDLTRQKTPAFKGPVAAKTTAESRVGKLKKMQVLAYAAKNEAV